MNGGNFCGDTVEFVGARGSPIGRKPRLHSLSALFPGATGLNRADSPVIVDHSIGGVEWLRQLAATLAWSFMFAALVDWMFALEQEFQRVRLFSMGCGLRVRIMMRWYHGVCSPEDVWLVIGSLLPSPVRHVTVKTFAIRCLRRASNVWAQRQKLLERASASLSQYNIGLRDMLDPINWNTQVC